MIRLDIVSSSKEENKPLLVNPALVSSVQVNENGDTLVTMSNGRMYIVVESFFDVQEMLSQ